MTITITKIWTIDITQNGSLGARYDHTLRLVSSYGLLQVLGVLAKQNNSELLLLHHASLGHQAFVLAPLSPGAPFTHSLG